MARPLFRFRSMGGHDLCLPGEALLVCHGRFLPGENGWKEKENKDADEVDSQPTCLVPGGNEIRGVPRLKAL